MDKLKKPNEKLRLQRELQGWSQARVAEKIGTTVKRVSMWECGDTIPGRYYQEALIRLFGKNAEELGFFKEEQQEQQISNVAPTTDSTPSQNILQASYQILAKYLQQQRAHLLDSLAPGSTILWVKDIVGDHGLFIPPPWKMLQGTSTFTDLVEYLIDALVKGQKILLLGDAGQGKTIVLKLIFTLLVKRFLDKPVAASPLPFYIPLRDLPAMTGNAIDLLWSYVCDEFPLPFDDFVSLVRSKQIVVLLDGFDEIKGELTQHSLNERVASKVFTWPSILSCRRGFFDFYLSMSALKEYYSQWVELQPLKLTQSVTQYITAFCQQKHDHPLQNTIATSEKIIKFLLGSRELQDLAQRPLLLVMMLDIFTDSNEISENTWNVTKLYRKYTEKWLKSEAAKPDSVLKWNEKDTLVQEVAWQTYTARNSVSSPYRLNQNETFTYNDLSSAVQNIASRYLPITEAQLLDDLCFRTLLAVSEGESYYFLHKSFHEYYVAKYIYNRLRIKEHSADATTNIGLVLQEVLPFEIVGFLKELLDSREIPLNEKGLIVENLIRVYQNNMEDELRAATIRQQASHYLACLGTARAIQFLEQNYEREANKWVQRGMMVGLALYCDKPNVLEQYIKMVREDPEAASINLGYHLVYYGDQAQELGYYDQGGERCDGTIKSLFRRLGNEKHKNGWTLDLLTLSSLLEQRGMVILDSYKQQHSLLREFLAKDYQELDNTFQREKGHLRKILQGAIVWT
ncbi:MAG: NACHT domain-containing protein [Ktedonobacteraceae bacterium]|nr:NACHT domain-containing protein [Ktedonobacteraceae bacterium]